MIILNKKYFNEKQNRSCSCCAFGEASPLTGEVLCKKHGVCDKKDFCRHFKYDILKRVPENIKPQSDFTADDFKID